MNTDLGRFITGHDLERKSAPMNNYKAPEQKEKKGLHDEKTDVWFAT